MPKLIKGNTVVDDPWSVVEPDGEINIGSDPIIIPLASWLELEQQARTSGTVAPWIESGEEFEEHLEGLLDAPLIALNFPTFMDGRSFSAAETLRQHGYTGEVRAIGNLIQDQLFFLRRCGFDTIQLREGTDLEKAIRSLEDFSVVYQTSADTEKPLFRKR